MVVEDSDKANSKPKSKPIIMEQKMPIDVKEDKKPLSFRLKMKCNHHNKETPVDAVVDLSSEESDDDDIPLSERLIQNSHLGTSNRNCDDSVKKGSITMPVKRPLDNNSISLNISVKKSKTTTYDHDIPVSQRLKKLAISADKSSSVKKKFKERELALVEKSIEDCKMKRIVEEKRLRKLERDIEERNRELEAKGEQLKSLQKLISESERQLRLKEEKCEMVQKAISEHDEGRVKELESKEKHFERRVKELKSKEKQLEGQVKELKSKEKQLEGQVKELESKERKLEGQVKYLKSEKDEIEGQLKELELEKKHFEIQTKELEEQVKELESKQKQFEGQPEELELNENQYESLIKSFEEGKDSDELEALDNDIIVNLQASSDPAKLVLDIIQNPIVPLCREGDNAITIDGSHIFLLEQLMRISPHVKPQIRLEAMKLALDLKANMKASIENSSMVLGFLLLLSIYGLVSLFDEDEVLRLFEFAAHHKQAVELFRTLGFADKISDFVQTLIKKKRYIEACRFICTYKSRDKNHPIDLLREYVQNAKNKSTEIKDKARDQETASLGTVLQYISDNNLRCGDPLNEIQDRILELQSQKANSICTGTSALSPKVIPSRVFHVLHRDSIPPAVPSNGTDGNNPPASPGNDHSSLESNILNRKNHEEVRIRAPIRRYVVNNIASNISFLKRRIDMPPAYI
ncbi:FRIGIDA-like protein 3 [Gastrolobium bilobum]|uniref:FRIGIDA-like protein 3 n=1 Tax=Gastrolobium bilobum TaxID=150636 RepID=UPI002AB32055|nr:FRIGIDA-like protein 3 [Gastrolobium bilobum]